MRLISRAEALRRGHTRDGIEWLIRTGAWQRVERGVYLQDRGEPTDVERAVAVVLASGGVASGTLAGHLHGLDSCPLRPPYATVDTDDGADRREVCRRELGSCVVVIDEIRCTDGTRTLIDLARVLTDDEWEQALESALREGLTEHWMIEKELASRRVGNGRIRRVLADRPAYLPPTESVLETMAWQAIRDRSSLALPERQVAVTDRHGDFVARVDLAWPDVGVFVELDGEHHKGQPVYDARRETAVVAATGWLPARFTWTEITRLPATTARRLEAIHAKTKRSAA